MMEQEEERRAARSNRLIVMLATVVAVLVVFALQWAFALAGRHFLSADGIVGAGIGALLGSALALAIAQYDRTRLGRR